MAKGRVSAQQLKRDPLMEQYLATSAWAKDNSRPILTYLTVAGVVLALALIAWLIFSRRSTNAAESLAEAFRVNDAVVANPIPANAQGYAFTTYEEKHKKAYEAFEKAAREYSSNNEVGRYYAATHQLHFEPDKAEATLKELAQQNSNVGKQARLALAGRYLATARYDQAIEEYKKLKDNPGEIAKAVVELGMARAYDAQGKTKEAVDLYFIVASDKDVRTTGVGNEAVSRLTLLDPEKVEKLPPLDPSASPFGGMGGAPISIR